MYSRAAAWLMSALALRALVGMHSHSGKGDAPRHGDFEAQRHWMELTIHTPPREWYVATPTNDLEYWGLDYPPLTAYHSWIAGQIMYALYPPVLELGVSRGHESEIGIALMRLSVLITDILLLFPFVWLVSRLCRDRRDHVLVLLAANPALLLIDHGHFQFNGVSLGLVLGAVYSIATGLPTAAAFWFCLALNFKQMALYYSPGIACYYLALWARGTSREAVRGILRTAAAIVLTFAVCWLPFVLDSPEAVLQVVRRIFPFGRGLFEDKVANFWCAIDPLWKAKQLVAPEVMIRICAATTIGAFLPSGIRYLAYHRKAAESRLVYVLATSALSFFLFSFHVHEKSVLLPLTPILLLFPSHALFSIWFLEVALFSMYPLFVKDDLVLVYGLSQVLVSLWICTRRSKSLLAMLFVRLSVVGMVAMHIAEAVWTPPAQYPDLFPVAISFVCATQFGLALLYLTFGPWTFSMRVVAPQTGRLLDETKKYD